MQVCKYQKFEFCKFRKSCKNQYLVDVCESLSGCGNIKICNKRQSWICKIYAKETFCRFEAGCAYNHTKEYIFKKYIYDFRCDKLTALKKHIKTKHTEKKCDVCGKEFRTSMEMIPHKTKDHHEEEDVFDVKIHSTPKEEEIKKASSWRSTN